MKTPDHQDLWRDALNDAAPNAFAEATLALTIARARRVRRTRHAIRIAASATVALVVTCAAAIFLRSPDTMAPNNSVPSVTAKMTPSESSQPVRAQAAKPIGVSVRYLTDEELLDRFPDQPVALVGSGSSREFLVLTNAKSN
jgi:hypothetical protein